MWKGKPCIMAYPDSLTNTALGPYKWRFLPPSGRDSPIMWMVPNGMTNGDGLIIIPSTVCEKPDGRVQQVTVGVAQNASPATNGHCSAFNLPGSYGRSFSMKNGFDPRVDGYLYGWNFQEQWNRALELYPELVFITGWNEYVAGQWLPETAGRGNRFHLWMNLTGIAAATLNPTRAGVTGAMFITSS